MAASSGLPFHNWENIGPGWEHLADLDRGEVLDRCGSEYGSDLEDKQKETDGGTFVSSMARLHLCNNIPAEDL